MYQVMCTTKDVRRSRIHSIGCKDRAGLKHTFVEAEAIRLIEHQATTFYVERPSGHRVKLIVHYTSEGDKFLKTEADGEKPNNLLELPHCKTRSAIIPPPRQTVPARSHGCAL